MTIREWLTKLICDENLLKEFGEDPEGVLERSGLKENQIRTLLSRDPVRIRHVIEYEENYDPEAKSMHLIFPIPIAMHGYSDPTAS